MQTRHRERVKPVAEPPRPPRPDYDGYLEMAAEACPGECNKLWRKRYHPRALDELRLAYITRYEPVPYEPDVRAIDRGVDNLVKRRGAWCDECAMAIRSAVGALPGLADKCLTIGGLEDPGRLAPTPPLEQTGGKHQKLVAPASPSPAFDMADLIRAWPDDWCRELAIHLDVHVPNGYSSLLGHWSALMAAPFAKRFGMDALQMRRRAELAAGVDDLVERLKTPCPKCRRKALEHRDGADSVECRNCKGALEMADYQRLAIEHRVSLEATG